MKVISEEKVIEIMSVPDISTYKDGFIEFFSKDVWTWSAVEDFVNEPFYSMEILHDIYRKITTKAPTESKEEKEALDSINQIHLRDYQKKNKTEHQEEMSALISANRMDQPVDDFLNELKVSAEWNGEGLPPVGVECEWIGGGPHGGWGLVIVRAYNDDYAWIEKLHDNSMYTVRNPVRFRKPETPQQREERERENLADLACESLFGESIQNCRPDVAATVRCMIEGGYRNDKVDNKKSTLY